MDAQSLLDQIRRTVRSVEPQAQIILYGSRARGDARPDSDWDLLVLLPGEVTWERKNIVRNRVYEVELASDEVVSLVVHGEREWESDISRSSPFYHNVYAQGVSV